MITLIIMIPRSGISSTKTGEKARTMEEAATNLQIRIENAVTRSFIHSFIHLFIYSFFQSFIHPFICSFVYLFVYSFIRLFVYSFIHLVV